MSQPSTKIVAVVGNPNTGKSTVFNALTGFHSRVGNFPGVTVEKKTGEAVLRKGGRSVRLVDLPGSYSLNARSSDEAVVMEVLLDRDPTTGSADLVLCVADACQLSRSLFFISQIIGLGKPVVVALNMTDLAEKQGLQINTTRLAEELGVPVVPIVARSRTGIDALCDVIESALNRPSTGRSPEFPAVVHDQVVRLREFVATKTGLTSSVSGHRVVPHGSGSTLSSDDERLDAELVQLLLSPRGFHESSWKGKCGTEFDAILSSCRERIQDEGVPLAELEAKVRYGWIEGILSRVSSPEGPSGRSGSDIIDAFLTHRVWGLLFFVLLMGTCFQALFSWAGPAIDTVDQAFASLSTAVSGLLHAGPLQSLLTDGVISGVGAVLVFLPQILILFVLIAVLEDCGYLARAALLLDRWMGVFGLNGKSLIPLVSSFACAVPGVLAARTIEDRKSKVITVLIAPLMSCSARLPVYVLLISAFVPQRRILGGIMGLQALTILAMYMCGIVVAMVMAIILHKFFLKGRAASFLMELPSYKWPAARTVFFRVYEQGKEFCLSAGTLIFAATIVIWALGYYPHSATITKQYEAMRETAVSTNTVTETLEDRIAEIDRLEAGAHLRQSFLGRMGSWIEPAVRPLGWDWRIGTAAIASFPAREVVIATLGTIYNLGDNQDESSVGLRDKLRGATWPDGTPVFNIAVALSIMVFFALCCQCAATLAVIKRELKQWRWPLITFAYMTGLAYVAALATYQVAIRLI